MLVQCHRSFHGGTEGTPSPTPNATQTLNAPPQWTAGSDGCLSNVARGLGLAPGALGLTAVGLWEPNSAR